jgi:hypothetical protein
MAFASANADGGSIVRPHPTGANEADQSRNEQVMNLRGAPVSVNVGVLVPVLAALVFILLVVLGAILLVAGTHRNSQIDQLHQHGQKVDVVVSGCLGLLGGSGSNPAGYACRGSFTIGGHRINEPIPGSTFRAPGTHLAAVSVPSDPALLATVSQLNGEQSSGGVYLVPAVLFVLALLEAGWFLRRRARRTATVDALAPTATED